MRRAHLVLALLALAAALCPAAGAGRHAHHVRPAVLARLTSTPALFPAFSRSIHDYVVRCLPGKRTRFTTVAAAGSAPFIDGVHRRTALLALRPDQAVTIEARNASSSADYHVRCLPADFPSFTETRTAASSDWYMLDPSLSLGTARAHYIVIFDGNGVPVWWYRTEHVPMDAKLLPGPKGPTFAFASYPANTPEYQIRTLKGTFVSRVVSPDARADDHDLQVAANGDYVYIVYEPVSGVDLTPYGGPADAIVLEPRIEEVSPDGKLVWSWSDDGRIGVSATGNRWLQGLIDKPVTIPGPDGQPVAAYDLFHPNAVSLDGNVVLLSVRHTDAVYAIDKATGAILWQLGGAPSPQRLTVVGDPYGQVPFGGQHDVRIQPDGTVSVFDDGSFLNRPPRVVRYAIDTTAHTATLVESVSDPAVTESICCGSARRMFDGDWLVSWGGDPVVGEYRPDGTPVFKLDFGALFSYRAVPITHRRLTIAELRSAMDAIAKKQG
jgi:hypothetical protein